MLSINAERYVWHSRSACTFRSVRMPAELLKICLVCIDICRKWNFPALFGIVTINSDSSRITSLLSMICTQASFFDPRRFTYDRPIRHYCKTRMKYFRLSSCSMNYQGRYLHCPRSTDARQVRDNPYWCSRNNFDSTAAGRGLSSTLIFDDHPEMLRRFPLPPDSRCYCYHRRCCTLYHLSSAESCWLLTAN